MTYSLIPDSLFIDYFRKNGQARPSFIVTADVCVDDAQAVSKDGVGSNSKRCLGGFVI